MASTIAIRVNGIDITNDVVFADAEFSTQASGSPGLCKFRLKDTSYELSFTVGQSLTLDVDGVRVWSGWVQSVKRGFFFPYSGSPVQSRPMARMLSIEGVDYNVLFRKRFCYDKANPANGFLKSWPVDTHDDVQIRYLCEHHLDLSGDGINYTTKVLHVGTPNPDARGNPAGPGWSWGDAMTAIGRYPGAIFYIDPDGYLVYADVDIENAAYSLSDTPDVDAGSLGYRDMQILHNGSNLVNDAMVWGVGQGDNHVKFRRTRDQASLDAHGLWQAGDFRGDLWRQASVDHRSHSFVYGSEQNRRGAKDDAISIVATIFRPAFRVADKVRFISRTFGFEDVIPVRSVRVTFPTKKDVKFELTLSHMIDTPWNTMEFWFPPIPKPEVVKPPRPGSECACGITDTFNRGDGSPGRSDAGIDWSPSGAEILSNQLHIPLDGNYAVLAHAMPFPFFASIQVTEQQGTAVGFVSARLNDDQHTIEVQWRLSADEFVVPWMYILFDGVIVLAWMGSPGEWTPAYPFTVELNINGTGVEAIVADRTQTITWTEISAPDITSVSAYSVGEVGET